MIAPALKITATTGTPAAGDADVLTITLVDQNGATVTSLSGDYHLTFSGLANAADGTHPTVTDKNNAAVPLGTPTTITFTSGSASRSLVACKAEGPVTLNATDGTSSTTSPGGLGLLLTISSAASKLVYLTSPVTTTAGVASGTIMVQRQDAYGNPVTSGTTSVTLSSSSTGTVIFDLPSPISITYPSSTATFTYADTKAGTPTITAAHDGVASATQVETVNQGAANKLAFTAQPGGGMGGTAWSTQPAVTLEDQYGNTVTGTEQNVTLAIWNNAGSGTLSGTRTVAVNTSTGVAAFSGLSIDKAGTGYTLTATGNTVSTSSGVVVSSSFNVTGATPSITGVANEVIAYGTATVTLTGTVAAGNVYPANDETVSVTINESTHPATITGGAGAFSVIFTTAAIPVSVSPYIITYHYAGDASLAAADNAATTLTVQTKAYGTMTLSNYAGAVAVVVDFVAKNESTVLGQAEGTFAASGPGVAYTIGVPAGTTSLSVKPRFYLRRNIDVTGKIAGNEVTLNLGLFTGGDVDGNNQVDGTDYAWLRYWWGYRLPGWTTAVGNDLTYDINGDGKIDASDFPDLNGDGVIGPEDYDILKDGWYQVGDPL